MAIFVKNRDVALLLQKLAGYIKTTSIQYIHYTAYYYYLLLCVCACTIQYNTECMYVCIYIVYLSTFPRTDDPTRAAAPAAPRAPAAKVCPAICRMESSGMRTTAPTAAAKDPIPTMLNTEGGTVMAVANKGRAPGASDTTFGNKGRTSGVAASTNTRMSSLSAANANKGSNLVKLSPASWALDNKPDCATLVNKPEDSTSSKSFLRAMLFPTESTSSRRTLAAWSETTTDRCV